MDNIAHFEMVGILCQISKAFLGESDVFYEVAKNLWDVAHLAHVTCYLYLGIWNMQVRCWEIQSNGGSVPKAAISHDHPVRLKKILHDYLNSFQAKTVSNSNVKRGHCVWVMDAKAIFGRNGD